MQSKFTKQTDDEALDWLPLVRAAYPSGYQRIVLPYTHTNPPTFAFGTQNAYQAHHLRTLLCLDVRLATSADTVGSGA
jgi:hypothetical protein